MKRLVVRIHHSSHPPYKLHLRLGTRVSDVLAYLNLTTENYVLQPLSDPSKTFTPQEDLYALIENDQKLIATLSAQAIEKFGRTFMQ